MLRQGGIFSLSISDFFFCFGQPYNIWKSHQPICFSFLTLGQRLIKGKYLKIFLHDWMVEINNMSNDAPTQSAKSKMSSDICFLICDWSILNNTLLSLVEGFLCHLWDMSTIISMLGSCSVWWPICLGCIIQLLCYARCALGISFVDQHEHIFEIVLCPSITHYRIV